MISEIILRQTFSKLLLTEDWHSFIKLFPSLVEDELKNILKQADPSYRDEKQGTCSESILRNFIKGNITSNDFQRIHDCVFFAKAFDKESCLIKSKTLQDYINSAQNICKNIPIIDGIDDTRIKITPASSKKDKKLKQRETSQYLRLHDIAKVLSKHVPVVYETNRFLIVKIENFEIEKIFNHTSWCIKKEDVWMKHTANKWPVYTIFDKNNYSSYQFVPYTLSFAVFDNHLIESDEYQNFYEIKHFISNILLQQKKEGYRFDIEGSCSQIVLKYFMDCNLYQYIDYNEIKQCVSNEQLKDKLITQYIYLSGNAYDALTLIKDTEYTALDTLPKFMFSHIKQALQNKQMLIDYGLSDLDVNKVYNFVK